MSSSSLSLNEESIVNVHRLSCLYAVFVPLTALCLVMSFSPSHGQVAADGKDATVFLADRHKNRGIECSGCHQESPPKQKPQGIICMGCHGDYSKVAEKTSKLTINPHDTHMGELDCNQCHKGHQRSVNVCNQCHTFNMKVP